MKISHIKLLVRVCIFSFTFFISTICFAAPTVISVSPEDGEIGTAIDIPLVITFSEEMSTSSEDILISAGPCGDSCPTFDEEWSDNDTVLTLTKSDGFFEADTTYTIEIGASSALDEPMAENFTWSFSTYIPLVLTEVQAIPRRVTAGRAIYYFDINEEDEDALEYQFEACSQNNDSAETLLDETNHKVSFRNLVVGNTYSCGFQAVSLNRGSSNILQIDPFTVYEPSSKSGSVVYGCKDPLATNYKKFARSKSELCKYKDNSIKTENNFDNKDDFPKIFLFEKDLSLGLQDSDVGLLQKKLNAIGFKISETGPGSVGYETDYFGEKTRAAVIRFQQAKGLPPVGIVGPLTRKLLNNL